MRLFLKLFEPFLQWFYRYFDRIVINGYLSFLTREGNVVYFFREVRGEPVLTKELLRQRTDDYQCWVENYALQTTIGMDSGPCEYHDFVPLAQPGAVEAG